MRACVRAFTLSNMNISTTSRPNATKFYLKHHWVGGKAALGFWPDRIGNLVSMATDSSHRVIMGKISFLIGSSSYLQITRTTIISRTSSKLGQIRPRTVELAALERLKISHRLIVEKSCQHSSSFIIDWIFFILAGNEDNYNMT